MPWQKLKNNTLVRKAGRWLWYLYLHNFLRRLYVRSIQNPVMDKLRRHSYPVVVVFFGPGIDAVGGGVMSIVDLARSTRRCLSSAEVFVCVCTAPWHPPLARYTRFRNEEILLDSGRVLSALSDEAVVIFQIPEIYVSQFSNWIGSQRQEIYGKRVHVNILLQNIDVIPAFEDVQQIRRYATVTCTTAHRAYANDATARRLGCGVSHLSAWVNPEKYEHRKTSKKERLIIYSSDENPEKESVLNVIARDLPDFRLVEIKNMRYDEYVDWASRAFASLSFGEGLDGYFVEPIFLGGIGCAVYNERFFTSDYRTLPFVYRSWDDLKSAFARDIRALEVDDRYADAHRRQFEVAGADYAPGVYEKLLKKLYSTTIPDAIDGGMNCRVVDGE